MDYKGFKIEPDKKIGFSLIDRLGAWCCSLGSEEKCIAMADGIIKTDKKDGKR